MRANCVVNSYLEENKQFTILTGRWHVDDFAIECEVCRVRPALTRACAHKSVCILFSHSAVRFLSM